MNEPRYVVVANREGKRWQAYERDLFAFWQRHGSETQVALIPWREVVPRLGQIDDLLDDDGSAIFRLESPGRGDFDVIRLLAAAGAAPGKEADRRSTSIAPTELYCPGLVHGGFVRTMRGLRAALDRHSNFRPLACPLAVAELFDKTATAHRLLQAGLPCPAMFAAPPDADQLLVELRERRFKTAYVKLNSGSSATGIAVVHALDDPPWAITSMLRLDDRFHNTRKLQRVSGADLNWILEFLLREGAIVQEGITMAQMDGQNFDMRVVVIYGEPRFTIFRLSNMPMTNLHLGGRRGNWAHCRAAIPTRAWLDALDHCADAARLYPCATVGVDLVFERGFARHYLLEINAFGDFFPGLTDDSGRTVHETEIWMTAQKLGLLPG